MHCATCKVQTKQRKTNVPQTCHSLKSTESLLSLHEDDDCDPPAPPPPAPPPMPRCFFDTPFICAYGHPIVTTIAEKFQSTPHPFQRRSPTATIILPSEQLQPKKRFELEQILHRLGRPLGLRVSIRLLDGTRLSFFFRNCCNCMQGKSNARSRFPRKNNKEKQVQIRGDRHLLLPYSEKIDVILVATVRHKSRQGGSNGEEIWGGAGG
jgi:hypothetical protein